MTQGVDRETRVRRNWIKGALYALTGRGRCPLCRGHARPVAASWMHSHLRCRRCGLIFVADLPPLSNLYDAYRVVHLSEYQVRHKRDWGPWIQFKDLTLDRVGLPRWERDGAGRALDLGCGEGRLLQVLRGRGWQATGLELNPVLAGEARRLGFEVVAGGVEHAALGGPFELITAFHLLEHLRSPTAALDRTRSWLRPGGVLVVETPLRPDFDNIDHLYCFSAASLELALVSGGFTPRSWFDYIDANYGHHNLVCLAEARA
jgi:SAM-dependent methyltransferase